MSHSSPACDTPVKRAALVNWWEGVTFLQWEVLFRMRVGLLGLPPVLVGRSSQGQAEEPNLAYRLRYCWSEGVDHPVRVHHQYPTHRRWPGPRGAMSDAGIEIGEPHTPAPGELGDLDHFLTARRVGPGQPPSRPAPGADYSLRPLGRGPHRLAIEGARLTQPRSPPRRLPPVSRSV
jgi:hypothetical protein